MMAGPTCISCKRPALYTWSGFCQTCYPPKRPHHSDEVCRHARCDHPAETFDRQLCRGHATLLFNRLAVAA